MIWKNKNIWWLLLPMLAYLLTACRTDQTDSAVYTAREYALENLHGITQSEREYIRFSHPRIFENVIFPRYVIPLSGMNHLKMEDYKKFPTAPHQDRMQSCVVWKLPGNNSGYVVVVGDGDRNMFMWNPYRVLIKRYMPARSALVGAVASCRSYAQNNMLYLTASESNRVRFADPDSIRYTKLDITFPGAEPLDTVPASELEKYLDDKTEKAAPVYTQVSLIWKGDNPDERLVFSGWTTSGTLAGWKLMTAELMTASKLDSHLLTAEEEAAVKKMPEAVPELEFTPEKSFKRTTGAEAPDSPPGGSFIYDR